MTQLLYNAGLYAMWDAVLASRPGLVIDNCASGGRRIDLETLSRSVPLWRSDFNLLGTHPESFQMQTMGLSAFSPVHAGTVDELTPYVWRSGGSMAHTIVGPLPSANDTAGLENLRAAQAEVLRLVAQAYSNAAIAKQRGTSLRAAEAMVQRVFAALGIEQAREAIARVKAAKLWDSGRIIIR
jgi:DNA-binding CsgD family transcriptional regulator